MAAYKFKVIKGGKIIGEATTRAEAEAAAKKLGGHVAEVVAPEAVHRSNPSGFVLTPADKKVISAFSDHRSGESRHLSSDGESLDGNWMGGGKIAFWQDDQIVMPDRGSKAADTVQRHVRKIAPANWLADKPARRGNPAGFALAPADKKVIDAFTDQKAAESRNLTSDGESLSGNWMGGSKLAFWENDQIVMPDRGSKAADTVQRHVRKIAPANWLADKPTKRNPPLEPHSATTLLDAVKPHAPQQIHGVKVARVGAGYSVDGKAMTRAEALKALEVGRKANPKPKSAGAPHRVYYDDQSGATPGWVAEYYDADGDILTTSENIGHPDMPTARSASKRAHSIAAKFAAQLAGKKANPKASKPKAAKASGRKIQYV